jgi:queuine/archaeosine tRNA-ribosyltransferase
MMAQARQAIEQGTFREFKQEFLAEYGSADAPQD